MIHTMYCTIYKHLQYANTIRNFLHTIWYVSCDTYRVLYNTSNYGIGIKSMFGKELSRNNMILRTKVSPNNNQGLPSHRE